MGPSLYESLTSDGQAIFFVFMMGICALPFSIGSLTAAIMTKGDKATVPMMLNIVVILVASLMGALTIGNAIYGKLMVDEAALRVGQDYQETGLRAGQDYRKKLVAAGNAEVKAGAVTGMRICTGPLLLGMIGFAVALTKRKGSDRA